MNDRLIINNLFWKLAERFGSQFVSSFISIILARILDTNDYGEIALITIIITILRVFVDSGLGTALIQKKDVDDLDYSTVFYTNVFLCAIVYVLIFFFAPYIAKYYNNLELSPIIRVLSITIILSGITNVQSAYVSRNMIFKRFFFATLVGTIIGGISGYYMATKGYGVWALVVQQLIASLTNTIVLWFSVRWKPTLQFSFTRLKNLFGFGWKLLISALIDTIYGQMRQLIIAKVYTTNDLAYYNRGEHFPQLAVNNINASIDAVLLPSMSSQQNDVQKIKDLMRKSIKLSVYVMAPVLLGLASVADKIILLLLTDKWADSIPFMRIFCIIYLLYPMHTSNLNAIKAIGRSDVFLKLEVIKKIIGITVIVVSMRISVWAMCVGSLIVTILSLIINSWPNKTLLNYSLFEQIKDITPYLLLAGTMAILVYGLGKFITSLFLSLIIQVVSGVLIYVAGSVVLKSEEYLNILKTIKSLSNRLSLNK